MSRRSQLRIYTVGGAVLHWAGDGITLPLTGFLAPWKVAFLVTGAPGLILAWARLGPGLSRVGRRLAAQVARLAATRWRRIQRKPSAL